MGKVAINSLEILVLIINSNLIIESNVAGRWWLTPVILATQETEIGTVPWSQPGQIVRETLSQKTLHKNRAGRVAQGEGPEFKPQYWKKKK
jgi:hypothetical protein